MKFIYFFASVFFITIGSAHEDPNLLQGVLENGLSYFVRANHFSKDKASLRLAVKVGSIYEQEEERGIAHFIEHLVFRGSQNFADGEMMQYLESIGAKMGADTNAYTSFNETVYILEVPIDSEKSLANALLSLADIAGHATISDESVEKERGVVLDEMRLRNGIGLRVFTKEWKFNFGESVCSNRLPIGTKACVQNATGEKLRRFYKKWYTPDRMAIIAVGDFDAQDVVEKIQMLFSGFAKGDNLQPPEITVPESQENRVLKLSDPELQYTMFKLTHFCEPYDLDLFEKDVIQALFVRILNMRLHRLSRQLSSPFIRAGCSIEQPIHPISSLYVSAVCWQDRPLEALKALLTELKRIKQYGFAKSEFEKVKADYMREIESMSANLENLENSSYVNHYLNHFLNEHALYSEEYLNRRLHETAHHFDLGYFNDLITEKLSLSGWNLCYCHLKENEGIEEHELKKLIEAYFENNVAKRNEKEAKTFSVTPKPIGGQITWEITHENGIIDFHLSNGLRVVFKKSNIEKNRIIFEGLAQCGLTNLDEETFPSALVAKTYSAECGVAGLNRLDLFEALLGKSVNFSFRIGLNERELYGDASVQDAETIFMWIYAFFCEKNFDQKVWDHLMMIWREYERTKTYNHEASFNSYVSEVNYSNHHLFTETNSMHFDEAKARDVMNRYFSNPEEFAFVFVGDFDIDQMREFTKKYLANIPQKEHNHTFQLNAPPKFPEGKHWLYYRAGKNEKSKTFLTVPTKLFDEKVTRHITPFIVTNMILKNRLSTILRKDKGKSYSIKVNTLAPFFPYSLESMSTKVEFSSSTTVHEELAMSVLNEMQNLQQKPPTQQEIDRVLKVLSERDRRDFEKNEGWLAEILETVRRNKDLSQINSNPRSFVSISPHSLQQAAMQLYQSEDFTSITWLPE